jgi:hypothetical protein
MATERQIAANRANAQRSTGPRTAAGKMKSSRNAFRHGLSGPVRLNPDTVSTIEALAQTLMPHGKGAKPSSWDFVFAQAVIELLALRDLRAEMWPGDGDEMDPQKLKRLLSLDRYDRYAHTRRRRAAFNLEESTNCRGAGIKILAINCQNEAK